MSLKRVTTKEGEVYFVDSKTGERVEVDSRYTVSNNSAISEGIDIRFKTLLGLGNFVSGFGWLIVIASVIALIYGISEIRTLGAIVIIGGVISLVNGILVVAVGQTISCFVSIEHNTYETIGLLKSILKSQNE